LPSVVFIVLLDFPQTRINLEDFINEKIMGPGKKYKCLLIN
jgi:hypothetical protein